MRNQNENKRRQNRVFRISARQGGVFHVQVSETLESLWLRRIVRKKADGGRFALCTWGGCRSGIFPEWMTPEVIVQPPSTAIEGYARALESPESTPRSFHPPASRSPSQFLQRSCPCRAGCAAGRAAGCGRHIPATDALVARTKALVDDLVICKAAGCPAS